MNGKTNIKIEIGPPKRETEKAVMFSIDFNGAASSADFRRNLWFPKSQIDIDLDDNLMTAPLWLLKSKSQDASDNAPCRLMMFGFLENGDSILI